MSAISKEKWRDVATLYTSGKPMREVAIQFGTSLDAVTYVLRKLNVPRRSAREANQLAFAHKPSSFQVRPALTSQERTLEAIGAMLYWGEGCKSPKATCVDLANSDPAMVILFLNFLRSRYALDEKRLRVLLYCYANQDVKSLLSFWSTLLQIPLQQFSKPYVRQDFRENGRKMQHGLVHIRYSDKKLLLDILNLIESYKSRYCVGTQAVNEDAL